MMLRRSKSERLLGFSSVSPRYPDFEGHFRTISHPIKDYERTYELKQDTTHPVFDNFTQQNLSNSYSVRGDTKSIKDRRILNSNNNETISVHIPPVRGRNTLYSINQSNSGVAQLNIPSPKLKSSKSLSSLKNKDYFHTPEIIKPIPSSYYTENIGIALGSPTQCDDFEMKVPLVSDSNSCGYFQNSYGQPSPKDLKFKSSKWRMFGGLFGRKRKETLPITAYHKYHGRPRPTSDSKSSNRALNAGKNKRKSVNYTKKTAMRPASRTTNFSRFNSSSPRVDGQNLKKILGTGKYDTLLDVEIPFTKMDRYSVILNEAKQNPSPSGQPPLYRRQTDLEKSVNGDSITNEQDINKFPKQLKKSSSSSQLKVANFPSFRDKSSSRTNSPIPKTPTLNRTLSKKPSTCLSIPKKHSIDSRTNDRRKNGIPESKNLNYHQKSRSDTVKMKERSFLPPSVPEKDTHSPMLSFPKESLLDFGFSKIFIRDGYQDFFASTPTTKQIDSSNLRPQHINYSEVPPSLSSISSSERSLSRSTSSSSITSPLGTTPLTGHFDEMRFPTPPIGSAVCTSITSPSLSAPTYGKKSSLSNYSDKKSSMHPSKTNKLKKSMSFSEKLGRTKSSLKLTSSQNTELKPNQELKSTPLPSTTASSPAQLKTYAMSSLDALAIVMNEEMERESYKLGREGNSQKKLRGGIHNKTFESKEQVLHGARPRNPNSVMVDTGEVKPRNFSKSLDLTRKKNENHERGTGSISNSPTWNSNKSPVVGYTAVSVARGIIAREYRKSHKAVVERMSVVGNI